MSKGIEQNNALQAKALRAAGCRKLFEKAASRGYWDRPELHRMLDQLCEGGTIVVWKLDRLSRSLKAFTGFIDRCPQSIERNLAMVGSAGVAQVQGNIASEMIVSEPTQPSSIGFTIRCMKP